jgi:hypothetical protein
MNGTGEHHVARIDDTVTARNLHARAEAVAVPDFDYLHDTIEAVTAGLARWRHHRHDSTTGTGPAQPAEK